MLVEEEQTGVLPSILLVEFLPERVQCLHYTKESILELMDPIHVFEMLFS